MPELPEVETIRRRLAPTLIGRAVTSVSLERRDIVEGAASRGALLQGCVVRALERKGKQLAILAASGPDAPARGTANLRVLVVHLGMTGQLLFLAPGARPERTDHVHCRWRLSLRDGSPASTLVFRDPRRFGRLMTFASPIALEQSWSRLGPDALDPPPCDHPTLARLWRSRRAIKTALLDQSCLAGVGNIYADESLFRAGVHPRAMASRLTRGERDALLNAVRLVLRNAIGAGGSTLRDYRAPDGSKGDFQARHLVYGQRGQPCTRCGATLRGGIVGQRSTVWCPTCQPTRRLSTKHTQSVE